jgi:hypothetical protein
MLLLMVLGGIIWSKKMASQRHESAFTPLLLLLQLLLLLMLFRHTVKAWRHNKYRWSFKVNLIAVRDELELPTGSDSALDARCDRC